MRWTFLTRMALLCAVLAAIPAASFGAAALDVVDDTLNDCYIITAYDTVATSVEYWEVMVDKQSGCLFSFKDLTDSGDGSGGHNSYLGTDGYGRQCSLLQFQGRSGRVFTRKEALDDLDDRLSFTAAGDGSSFTITYSEDASSTDYFHSYYSTYLYPGDMYTTITLNILPPTASGTAWTWSIDGENVSGATMPSKVWAQQYTVCNIDENITKTLDSDNSLTDGAWNPSSPVSFMRWTIGSNSLGLTSGREFIVDVQDGLDGEALGGNITSANWATCDYSTYSAACSYSGTDIPDGQSHYTAGELIIDIASTVTPPVADAGEDDSEIDDDDDGYASITLDGTGSYDSDGTITSYVWTEGTTQVATGATPTVSLAIGQHTLTLTVTDDDTLTDTDNVVINIQPAVQEHTVVMTLQEIVDDTRATASESVYLNDVMYLPYRNTDRLAMMRFQCEVPPGATITSATLKLHTSGASTTAATAQIQALDFDDCPKLSSPNPFTYAVTGDTVDWVMPTNWADGTWISSPDLSDIVQDFIDGANYEFRNYLGLRGIHVSGGTKVVHQWDYDDHSYGPQLEVTYTGGIAEFDVLMADPETRIAQKIYCRTFNINDYDTLEALVDGVEIFSKIGSQVAEEEVFVADYSNLTAGNHTLTIRVVAPDETTVRGQFTRTWTTLHSGIPAVGINEHNAICVNGTPFLPVTPWILRTDRVAVMDDCINSLLGNGWYATNDLAQWQHYLSTAQTNGLYMAGPTNFEGKVASDLSQSDFDSVENYINSTKNHPSLLAWFWHDEPDLYLGNAPGTRMLHEVSHENDTNHPTWTNLVGYRLTHNDDGGYISIPQAYCYMYNESLFGERTVTADIMGIDYYPHEYSTNYDFCNISDYLVALDRVQQWNYNLLPSATFIQPCDEAGPTNPRLGGRDWTPPPTPAMTKNLVWLSLIHEAKVISWFTYFEWFPTPDTSELAIIEEAYDWIIDLTQPLLSDPDNVTETITVTPDTGYRVDFLPRKYDGDLYIFAGDVRDWGDPVYIQPDQNDIYSRYFNIPQGTDTARFDVSGLADDTVITVYGESRTIISEAGYFEDDFGPQGVHIYIIDGGTTSGSEAETLIGDVNADGTVDIFDFLILKSNYGASSGASLSNGDLDEDGDVDIFDFLILKTNYGSSQ